MSTLGNSPANANRMPHDARPHAPHGPNQMPADPPGYRAGVPRSPNEQAFARGLHEGDAYASREGVGRERSLAGLLRDLRDEAVTLVQQEFRLARVEVAQEVDEARRAVMSSIAGVGLLLVATFILALALSAGLFAAFVEAELGPLFAVWLAPLIVGLTGLIIGLIMVNRARTVTSAQHWRPTRTEQSLRETKRWAERKL